MHAQSINALKCIGFNAISQSSERCKERLRLLRREEPEDLDPPLEDDEESSLGDSPFGDGYEKLATDRVNAVCQQRVDEFLSDLSGRIDHFVNEVDAERGRLASAISRIWKARATLVGRFALVTISLAILLFAFAELAPSQFDGLLSIVSEGLFESILIGTISTGFVLAVVFVITGAKNENMQLALRPVFLEKWTLRTKRRHLVTALKSYFDESYNQLIDDLNEMPLQIDNAIAEGVVEWLKSQSESHRKSKNELAELRQIIVERCQLFDEFIGVFDQHLNHIPIELRETASGIKSNVIEEHMSRIRGAATSVEDVKSDVERLVESTRRLP